MSWILHITTREQWESARKAGLYRPASLDTEGFIHCSTPQQVIRVANAFYRGQEGLVLLCIEPEKVKAPIRYEAPVEEDAGGEERFPHIYGPLNADAVVRVMDFPPGEDGTFTLPGGIA
ncbi:MAG TPA: DUF952 domain-containing protein [Chloroflexi bacterium]|nr:DUF952 domain-containing protein [Chloroflexota bacterium]